MPTFNLWDTMGGEYPVEINDLPQGYQWYTSNIDVSRFNTAAVVLTGQSTTSPYTQAKELRLVDLETGRVMAGRPMLTQEALFPSLGRDTTFFLGQYTDSALVIRGYDFSLSANSISLSTPATDAQTFSFPTINPERFLQNSFTYFPPSAEVSYAVFQGGRWDDKFEKVNPEIYRANPNGTLELITLPLLNLPGWGWGGALFYDGYIWVRLGKSGSAQTESLALRTKLEEGISVSGPWETLSSSDLYWDIRDLITGADTVVRDGQAAYDISLVLASESLFWIDSLSHPLIELPDDKVLIRAEVSKNSGNANQANFVDFSEYWFVYERGETAPYKYTPLNVGTAMPFFSIVVDDPGYVYLQGLNLIANDPKSLRPGERLQDTQEAVKVYRVSIDEVENFVSALADGGVVTGFSTAQLSTTFSQYQLSGGRAVEADDFVAIGALIFVSDYVPGDNGKIVFSFIEHVPEDRWTNLASRIEADGSLTRSTQLDLDVDSFVIDPTHGVFLAENYGSRYLSAVHVDFTTGLVTSIPNEYFAFIEEDQGIPEGVLFTVGDDTSERLGSSREIQDQWIIGGRGDDTLVGSSGSDLLYGGEGEDSVVYAGQRSQFRIALDNVNGGYRIYDLLASNNINSSNEFDRIIDIEKLVFSDQTLSLTPPPVYLLEAGTTTLRGEEEYAALLANQRETLAQIPSPTLTIDGASARYRVGIPTFISSEVLGEYSLHASTFGAGLIGVFHDTTELAGREAAAYGAIKVSNGARVENTGSLLHDANGLGLPNSNLVYAFSAFGWGKESAGTLQVEAGAKVLTSAQFTHFVVGNEGASGNVTVRGVGSEIVTSGHRAEIWLGRDGGTGALAVEQGGALRLDSSPDSTVGFSNSLSVAQLSVGQDGGTGVLRLNGVSTGLAVSGYNARVEVGFYREKQGDSNGLLEIYGGARARIEAITEGFPSVMQDYWSGAFLAVGFEERSAGSTHYAYQGRVDIDGAGSRLELYGPIAGVSLGGGASASGVMTLTNGASLLIESFFDQEYADARGQTYAPGAQSYLIVGGTPWYSPRVAGGDGYLRVDASDIRLQTSAPLTDEEDYGYVSNSLVLLSIGSNGARGVVEIVNGATVDVYEGTETVFSWVSVGPGASEAERGGEGFVRVSGDESLLKAKSISVGTGDAGQGTVSLKDGGTLQADNFSFGAQSRLVGSGRLTRATPEASAQFILRGEVSPGDYFDEDFFTRRAYGGVLFFEGSVYSDNAIYNVDLGAQSWDQLHVEGDFYATGGHVALALKEDHIPNTPLNPIPLVVATGDISYNLTTTLSINGMQTTAFSARVVENIEEFYGVTRSVKTLELYTGVEGIPGSNGADTITGTSDYEMFFASAGNDTVFGDGGNDGLFGGSGHDSLHGGEGDDRLWGESGNDTLRGWTGNDTIDGGLGLDIVQYQGRFADYAITENTGGLTVTDLRSPLPNVGVDILKNIEVLRFLDRDVITLESTPAMLPGINGRVYHWKTGTLLTDVAVAADAIPGSVDSHAHLFEFRNGTLSDSSFEAELWVNISKGVIENLDIALGFASAASVSVAINSAVTGWRIDNAQMAIDDIFLLSVSGLATDTSRALDASVKIGDVTATWASSQDRVEVGFLSGVAGAVNLTAYSVGYGSHVDETTASGLYTLLGLPSERFTLDAGKSLGSTDTGSAIGSADALAALKIAVGRNPNSDGAPVSPYQFISADVNGDGKVTSADALAILKMAVKRSDAPAREWIFVDEKHDFWDEATNSFTVSRTSVPKPADLAINVDPTARGEVNIVALLKGDVNGSWTDPLASTSLSEAYFTTLVAANPNNINIAQFG